MALVYLGFIGATEMVWPFAQDVDWDKAVKEHSAPLFPSEIWNRSIDIRGVALIPVIRTSHQPLD